MNKILLISLISSFLFFSFTKEFEKKIDVKLIDIQYYSINKCNIENHIYVRILYKVKYKDVSKLKIKHDFNDGISMTSSVNETDKKGNVVYGFCCSQDENKNFITTFISPDGLISNKVTVKINSSFSEIISGTPPQTIKTN